MNDHFLPDRIFQFLDDKVQIVPTVVSKQSRVKAQCYRRDLRFGIVERKVFRVSYEILFHLIIYLSDKLQNDIIRFNCSKSRLERASDLVRISGNLL